MQRISGASALAGLLYLFLISIGLVGASFKLFGNELAEQIFHFTSNPICGLFVGILATSLVQSSSTTTSIVVGLVGSGDLNVVNAVPIVMGANIGTSVTNTLVSLGHIARGNELKRAFAAATVHDFFNLLSVLILLPLQCATNFLGRSATWIASVLTGGTDLEFESPIKAIIQPVVHGLTELVRHLVEWLPGLSDRQLVTVQAAVLLVLAAALLFTSLRYMTRILRAAVVQKASGFFERTFFRTPVVAFAVGMVLTAIVQSSSVTTSMVVPLAGAGVLTLSQIYPYTIGSNVGTTITGLLAAFAATQDFRAAVAVALSHLLFNICGICVIMPYQAAPHFADAVGQDVCPAIDPTSLGALRLRPDRVFCGPIALDLRHEVKPCGGG